MISRQLFANFKQFDVVGEICCVLQAFDFNPERKIFFISRNPTEVNIFNLLEPLLEVQNIFVRIFIVCSNQCHEIIGSSFRSSTNECVNIIELLLKATKNIVNLIGLDLCLLIFIGIDARCKYFAIFTLQS